jgi:8-oxo-dGTP diphosphatase
MQPLEYLKDITYTCGLAFNKDLTQVLLIYKNKGPKCNVGRWNGIGGKIELGESHRGCMVREFKEECGIETTVIDWHTFHIERYGPSEERNSICSKVYFMTCVLEDEIFYSSKTIESEQVEAFSCEYLRLGIEGPDPVVYNMPYLLPMARIWLLNPEHRYLEG